MGAIPIGTSVATLAKFWVASLALDASVVAAGGSLALSGDVIELTEPTSMGEQLDEKRLYRQNGQWRTGRDALAAQM
jgi:hypothetical protein